MSISGLIIEDAGRLYAVEIKSGQPLSGDMLDSLLWWSNLTGQSTGTSNLVFGGDQAFTHHGISVRPWLGVYDPSNWKFKCQS